MSDTAVDEHSTGEAIDLQQYATGVISEFESRIPREVDELVSAPSTPGNVSIRSRMVKMVILVGRLCVGRNADPVKLHHRARAASHEHERYRHDVPFLRFP